MKINPPATKDRATMRKWLMQYRDLSSESLAIRAGISVGKVIEWRIKYDVVDIKDEKLFKAWIDYKKYTIPELAILLNRTHKSVADYIKKYGITKYKRDDKPVSNYRSKSHVKEKSISTDEFKDKERFAELYSQHGTRVLARMAGVSYPAVRYYVRKHGLKPRPPQWKGLPHPCKNREWLIDKYIKSHMKIRECAEEAGVCRETICNWLIQFGIKPRNWDEAKCARSAESAEAVTCVSDEHADT